MLVNVLRIVLLKVDLSYSRRRAKAASMRSERWSFAWMNLNHINLRGKNDWPVLCLDFEFVDQPFVFIHCHVITCNASNPQSRCARGCEKKARLRRDVEHHNLFSLAQGPITLDHEIELDQKHVEKFSVNNMDSFGKRKVQLGKVNIHKKGVHLLKV